MNRIKVYTATEEEKTEIQNKIRTLLKKERKIVFAFLHGSFLSDTPFRDIDIGILVEEISPSEYYNYEFELSEKIRSAINVPYDVDVKVINKAPLSFRFHVIRGRAIYSKDPELIDEYIISTARFYFDIQPLRRRYILEQD
ncbi:MAG: nucleotidyltransferase domain-containing protein [Deltaproteobacteria bacterium]|nr:MAG: nucleotidyltransferase domain-containing protein [Deltaproteobacteria bacterium]